jgi:hypothetical protein
MKIKTTLFAGFVLFAGKLMGQAPDIVEQVIRDKQDTAKVYYEDSVARLVRGVSVYQRQLLKKRKYSSYNVYNLNGNKIVLTRREKGYINKELLKMRSEVWPVNLFANSVRVPSDSAWQYIRQLARQNFAGGRQSRYQQLWSFSRPIYLRNNTICLFSWTYICHSSCGEQEILFYKKNAAGRWERYVFLDGRVF